MTLWHGHSLRLALGVVMLLRDQWAPLEADFQRFYGMDLAKACWGSDQVGVRRLYVLIRALPQESSLAREMGWAWDDEKELNATLIDLAMDQAQSMRATAQGVAALGGGKYRPRDIKPFPRPVGKIAKQAVEDAQPLNRHALRGALLNTGGR